MRSFFFGSRLLAIHSLAVLISLGLAGVAPAALSPYSQDFEGMDTADPSALSADGWLVFANVFGPGGAPYLYGYGPFPAPNGTGGFSNVTDVAGGAPVGNRGLVAFSDYNNNGAHVAGDLVESNVFQEQVIGAGDVGKTVRFSFVAKPGDLASPSTALAFIKTLNPMAGYALTNFPTVNTTSLPSGNSLHAIDLFIDGTLPGQILQFGFLNNATAFAPSGVNYDNVNFVIPEPGTIMLSGLGLIAVLSGYRRK